MATYYHEASHPFKSPIEGVRADRTFYARRILFSKWEERYLALAEIWGNKYPYVTVIGGPCEAWPLNFEIEPFDECVTGTAGTSIAYSQAKITVDYGQLTKVTVGGVDAWVAEGIYTSLEMVNSDPSGMYWSDQSPVTPQTYASVYRPQVRYLVRMRGKGTIPANAIGMAGRVNSVAFNTLTLGFTFDAGHVLYDSHQGNKASMFCESPDVDVTYSLRYNPFNWHMVYRPEKGTYEFTYDRSGNQIFRYPVADLNALF